MARTKTEALPPPEQLIDRVRELILSGAIPPDVSIRQDVLARELRVSKIPVREALARLETDGLVVSYPNRGYFVRPMSLAEAEEIYDLRLKLEPETAARACVRADAAAQEAAREALRQFDKAAASQPFRAGVLNRAFHLALTKPSGQDITTSFIARLHVMADRYVRRHLEPWGRLLLAEEEHHQILDAWLNRRADEVRQLIVEHLDHTMEGIRREMYQAERPTAEALARRTARSDPGASRPDAPT